MHANILHKCRILPDVQLLLYRFRIQVGNQLFVVLVVDGVRHYVAVLCVLKVFHLVKIRRHGVLLCGQ